MKKIITLLILISISFISYSQIGIGLGYEHSSNIEYNSAVKINIESLTFNNKKNYKGFIFGLDLGINFINNDKTGEVSLNQNPQDETGNYVYTIITPGFKLGYLLGPKFYFVGAAGLNMVQEYREFNSSSIGLYVVETDYKKTSPYFRAGVQWVSDAFFNPGIGFGTNGIYVNNTFYIGGDKVKEGNANFIDRRRKNKEKYKLGGYVVTDIDWNDWDTFVDVFIKEYEKKVGIIVNRDNLTAEHDKTIETIVKSSGKDNDEQIEIYFNKKLWKKANIDTRLYVLFHELGRDILNLDYNQGGKMTSKLSDGDSYNWNQFKVDSDVMFEMYNKILLKEKQSKSNKSRRIID
jgi:hypothetical protein